MQNFRELIVWQKAHSLALALYKATEGFPKSELYGLTSQIRRAGAFIPANIAEGCGRGGRPELAQFVQISVGSASELEYHLLLARDLQFLAGDLYEELDKDLNTVKRMMIAFLKRLRD